MVKILNKIFNKNKYKAIDKEIIRKFNTNRDDEQNKIIKTIKKNNMLLCYAPFNNIFFNSQGQITACCRSSYIFDKFPEKKLKDIWFGSEFSKLRDPIKHDSLSVACQTCQYPLEKGDFDNVMAKIFDRNYLNKNKYPTVLEFELINTCNLECIMCLGTLSSSIRKNRDKMPPLPMLYDQRFIEQLKDFIPHIHEAKFYGGEPFLINIYFDILDTIININPNVRISITTNGTILNNRIRDLLGKLKFNINVSVDSINKENFENIRKNADFDVVMQNLLFFQEHCKQNDTIFCVCVSPMRQNWKEIPDIITYFNNIDSLVSFSTVYDPPDCALWNLNDSEIQEIYDKLSLYSLPENSIVQKHNKNKYNAFLNQLIAWRNESYEKKKDNFKACIV